ncbi:MAG: hypothetical protein HUJ68_01460 [Clostridia bacterium]|nr:hypothetical protein [Clostridia bacterium]
MSKKLIKYNIKHLNISKDKYIINSDESITINDLTIVVEEVKYDPPHKPGDKQKPSNERKPNKKKDKRMTEKRVNELIDKAIQKNNVYLLSEMDKKIDQKIENNNFVLLRAVRDIVKEEVAKVVAPINDKLDKVIELNNLKTK